MDGSKSVQAQMEFLKSVYPKFKRQYEWFHKTQGVEVEEWEYTKDITIGFKWRGRNGKHILTSGMDDYPRSAVAHPGDLHLDLISWIYYFSKRMEGVASILGLKNDVLMYKLHQDAMSTTLNGYLMANCIRYSLG